MDTSEKYIEMCKKAEEIQPPFDHPWDVGQEGDYWTKRQPRSSTGYEVFVLGIGEHLYFRGPSFVWLPRQDQLQEMVKSGSGSPIWMIRTLDTKIQSWYDNGDDSWASLSSMEQLWLAFVMKEKYNKVWNGEEWVKE